MHIIHTMDEWDEYCKACANGAAGEGVCQRSNKGMSWVSV